MGENIAWEDTKKFRDQKRKFEKRSKTFRGTLVRKLYLNFQLCISIGVKSVMLDKHTETEQSLGKPEKFHFPESGLR